ncbi:unnamed protein product [Lampetra fluviatilis]
MASEPARAGSGGAQSDSDPEDSPPRPGGRRGTRREKNRVAAQKSRQKQTQRADILHQESETLEQENAALRREIESLRVELHSLDALLRQHEARCYHGTGGGGGLSTGVLAGGGPRTPAGDERPHLRGRAGPPRGDVFCQGADGGGGGDGVQRRSGQRRLSPAAERRFQISLRLVKP